MMEEGKENNTRGRRMTKKDQDVLRVLKETPGVWEKIQEKMAGGSSCSLSAISSDEESTGSANPNRNQQEGSEGRDNTRVQRNYSSELKKRATARKVKTEDSKPRVPLKRRKIAEGDETAEAEEIPEDIRFSIQLFLLNCYENGEAIVNNLHNDYNGSVEGANVDPKNYGYDDWESMLRSPQFKTHCKVFQKNRICHCKGIHLPRSAGIILRKDGVVEIHPSAKEQKPTKKALTINTSNEIVERNKKDGFSDLNRRHFKQESKKGSPGCKSSSSEDGELTSEDEDGDESSSGNPSKSSSPKSSNQPSKINDRDRGRKSQNQLRQPLTSNPPVNGELAPHNKAKQISQQEHSSVKTASGLGNYVIPKIPSQQKQKEVPVPVGNAGSTQSKSKVIEVATPQPQPTIPQEYIENPNSKLMLATSAVLSGTQVHQVPVLEQTEKNVSAPGQDQNNAWKMKAYLDQVCNQESIIPRLSLSGPRQLIGSTRSQEPNERIKGDLSQAYFRRSNVPDNYELIQVNSGSESEEERSGKSLVIIPNTLAYGSNSRRRATQTRYKDAYEKNLGISKSEASNWDVALLNTVCLGLDDQHFANLAKAVGDGEVSNPLKDPRLTNGIRSKFLKFLQNSFPTPVSANDDVFTNASAPLPNNDYAMMRIDRTTAAGKESTAKLSGMEMVPVLELSESSTNIRTNLNYPVEYEYIPVNYREFSFIDYVSLWKKINWKACPDDSFPEPPFPYRTFFWTDIIENWKPVEKDLKVYQIEMEQALKNYEEVKGPSECGGLVMRSSLRMVEIDYRTKGAFVNPRHPINGQPLVGPEDVLFYVDLGGTHGGVVEFYDRFLPLQSKGFGLCVKKDRYDIGAIPGVCEDFFETFYGNERGKFVSDEERIETFITSIMRTTDGEGVHVVSSVGTVSTPKYFLSDCSDDYTNFPYLSQVMIALRILCDGGNLALKVHDLKQPFGVALVYFLYRSFHKVQICQLETLPPASGERVVICLGKRNATEIFGIVKFLERCVREMRYKRRPFKKTGVTSKTIVELIPMSQLEQQVEFMKYIRNSNERIQQKRRDELKTCLGNLRKKKAMFPEHMVDLLKNKIPLWKIPDIDCSVLQMRHSTNRRQLEHDLTVPKKLMDSADTYLNHLNLAEVLNVSKELKFVCVGDPTTKSRYRGRGFYMGLGGFPKFYDIAKGQWETLTDDDFGLPKGTVIYGEIVDIYDGNGASEEVLIIIDAFVLAGYRIQNFNYAERLDKSEKFCKCLTQAFPSSSKSYMTVTVVRSWETSNLSRFLGRVELESSVRCSMDFSLRVPANDCFKLPARFNQYWFVPSGVLFLNNISTSANAIRDRIYWTWVKDIDLPLARFPRGPQNYTEPFSSVSARKLLSFIEQCR